ncbi:hypothetical protein ACFQ3P_02095 [Paraburkholderia sabiae]|jgi:hypothetical protein|uniref:Uncharacterized protein n=1 Tax=Paraburkholderia sabiae TaxID=273251 RepID=A0ABU9Q9C5_9BURK|nr:hypothetical protein [Paraburkholderia sabiae]WJZ78666.1 hypothetical protein QEN71_32305 [Paraburkholderia sabiae]CAD6511019.1 hypothetical protein LMG24235_00418 [Paraburkholderia sabiae]CAG9207217.1 conserved hypothetical protein [Paraburkholderia sabiae]
MKADERGDVRAFVQTAEQAGDYVWVIALVDFGAREVKRTIVSDETYKNRAAAKDAGEARLKALEEDRHAHA